MMKRLKERIYRTKSDKQKKTLENELSTLQKCKKVTAECRKQKVDTNKMKQRIPEDVDVIDWKPQLAEKVQSNSFQMSLKYGNTKIIHYR